MLAINANGTAATWFRSGSGPEVEQVTFEQSPDGATYRFLGSATRVNGGWELTGLSLPSGQNFYLRARGRATWGILNGSSSLIETVAQFYRTPSPQLASLGRHESGPFQFFFTNAGGYSYRVLATTNLALPAVDWETLDPPVPLGGGVYRFSDPTATNHAQRFYQLRWP